DSASPGWTGHSMGRPRVPAQGRGVLLMRTTIHRVLLAALTFTSTAIGLGVTLPATAGAYATLAPPPLFSSAPGLPDGRVYEQVSPANKHGYGTTNLISDFKSLGNATAAGNGIMYIGEGPLADGSTTGS